MQNRGGVGETEVQALRRLHIKGTQCISMTCALRLILVLACLPTPSAPADEAGVSASAAVPDSWPQWRGPLANGVAPRANPPVHWSETNNIRTPAKKRRCQSEATAIADDVLDPLD